MDWLHKALALPPLEHTCRAKGDGQKGYRAKMCIVGDWREFQNELITTFRKGMPRRVVALIRAGGDVTRYWHWRALRTLGVACVEDMSISHRSIKMVISTVFALCDYRREKRGRDTDSVIPLRDLPCLSYDCYFISRFFLVNRDPY